MEKSREIKVCMQKKKSSSKDSAASARLLSVSSLLSSVKHYQKLEIEKNTMIVTGEI